MVVPAVGVNAGAVPRREAIEELQADFQGKLLARERVDQRFEQRRKPRWFDAAKSGRDGRQPFVSRRQAVPTCEVEAKTEQTIENASDLMTLSGIPQRRRRAHNQPRLRR